MFQSARHIPHVLHAERAVDRAARRGRRRPVRGGLAAQRAEPRPPPAQRRPAPRLQRRALLHQTSAPGQGQKLTKRPIMSERRVFGMDTIFMQKHSLFATSQRCD